MARRKAGSTAGLWWRVRRELRDLLVELRDLLVGRVEAGLVASSIAVRFRANAVLSVCAGAPIYRCRTTMPESEFTCPHLDEKPFGG